MQFQNLILIVVMVGAFYFLLIRPQQKRQQAQRDLIAGLKAGDEIVTIGGIFVTVIEVGDRIRVRTIDGSELELAKQAIGSVIPASDEADEVDEVDEEDEVDTQEVADDALDAAPADEQTPAAQQ